MAPTPTSPAAAPRPVSGRPPGPAGRFLVGHTFDYMRDPLAFLTQLARDHGDLVRIRLGTSNVFVVNHPELIAEVLRTHAADEIKDEMTRMLIPLVGRGLLTSEGDFWKRQRKLATPAFQHHQIEAYGQVMVDAALHTSAEWTRAGDAERNLADDMAALTLAIVGKTLFGADVGDAAHRIGPALAQITEYYLNPYKWFRIREWLPTKENREFRASVRLVDEIIFDLIRRRREALARGETGFDDLLGGFLEAQDDEGTGMTDAQLRDECITLFLAGHETTALALFYVFTLLAQHPEVDTQLVEELHRVLGDRPPTAADLPNLPYTEAVVRETLRVYPPAWAIGREAVRPFTLGGYPVPPKTQLIMAQWVVHRDPRWWDDPGAFRPERWANDLIRRLPRGVYFPFGDGPRVCIGNHFALMEAVLVLATLARKHRPEPVPGQTLSLIPSITLRPKGASQFRIRGR